ncbi:HelD family protein [Desulfitobacterium metallireducens]|uniref:ATP-dependent DNA helicase replicase n=1 Tax=Desulfitobacterium metallireducens DSM 15288 TaxID=871968 RepID=W0EF63_9FIRM|nr:UvrD-helicase domain-containing protein [Desulfitobacterium metallireducens]AHF07834.1 ATP-dependent DNA helicase replicase [Desulfitobacterium metallireducens DSM 15288]
MKENQAEFQEEVTYLNETVNFIQNELHSKEAALSQKKNDLIASRKDMWDDTVHMPQDIEDLIDIYKYISEINSVTTDYANVHKSLNQYKKALEAPYFARIDILEEGFPEVDKIYIGLMNIMDKETLGVYVYDWRAPLSGLFYRYELGPGSYSAPLGTIQCEISRKRQFKILNSQLKYFFDCSLAISDAVLQEVLSRNSSPQMRSIVETIQREQDLIIRDVETELLIVQGSAGSGKTSIALHRIAFLLYHGLSSGLNSSNFLILSPNDILNQYISTVLPELGEENVQQTTFDSIAFKLFPGELKPEGRSDQLEKLISLPEGPEKSLKRESIEFKGSHTFVQILDRYIDYYAKRIVPFQDVYFNGVFLATRQQLKNRFLKNEIDIPMAKQLKKIEKVILDKVHPLQKERLKKIEQIVQQCEGHELEVKPFSRLLSLKEGKKFLDSIQTFTQVDCFKMYQTLFTDKNLFLKLSQGLELPQNIEEILSTTDHTLKQGQIGYEDCAPLLYLTLKVEGSHPLSEIKHVIIDEAQDYYPIHYEVFKHLFNKASFTLLGDINQTIEKNTGISLYDDVINILNKKKSLKLFLTKSYRSSYEVNEFTQKILGPVKNSSSFERHEAEPQIVWADNFASLTQQMAQAIDAYLDQGYESIGIVCKSQQDATTIYYQLLKHTKVNLNLVTTCDTTLNKGVSILSAYMAKGLEFDAVLVYQASAEKYSSEFDRKLLYVACTRALHRLSLYYTGELSGFLKFSNTKKSGN